MPRDDCVGRSVLVATSVKSLPNVFCFVCFSFGYGVSVLSISCIRGLPRWQLAAQAVFLSFVKMWKLGKQWKFCCKNKTFLKLLPAPFISRKVVH